MDLRNTLHLFWMLLFFVNSCISQDIYVRITPAEVYLDTDRVAISCIVNMTTINVKYITINRNGWYGKKLLATAAEGSALQTGYFFRDANFTSRMSLSGGVRERYLKVVFSAVDCLDEGHYECEAGGFDDTNTFRYLKDFSAIVIKSHVEMPTVSLNGIEFPDQTPLEVAEGTTVKIECDAHVGKPPRTMYWYRYDQASRSYVLEKDMLGKAERRLPVNELCKWYTTFPLSFTASLAVPEIQLKCAVGHYQRDVIINVHPKVGP